MMARRNNAAGFLALVGLGALYLYRNRYKIQQFLESRGVQTPVDRSSVGSAISSGIAKISGRVQHDVNQTQRNLDRKVG